MLPNCMTYGAAEQLQQLKVACRTFLEFINGIYDDLHVFNMLAIFYEVCNHLPASF